MDARSMVCLDDFEKHAREILPLNARVYFCGGADEEVTLKDNVRAYSRWRLIPRVLVDVSNRELGTTILGHRIAFPVCISPTAMHTMAHPGGELATARAANAMCIGYTLSTGATTNMVDIANTSPGGLRFFQMSIYRKMHRHVNKQLIEIAEKSGFKALLITVDQAVIGNRLTAQKNNFKIPSYARSAIFSELNLKGDNREDYHPEDFVKGDTFLTWSDIDWLKNITSLPIVIKGILSAKDANLAAEKGVAGILVSNHGARQLDTVPATIDALPSIISAVRGRCEVYLDGGIRRGTDVLKALALGARAVFIGRPVIYGLAYDGENGVKQVIGILRDEFSAAMALAGASKVSDISSDLVVHNSHLSSML